jgi:hypothetical protein
MSRVPNSVRLHGGGAGIRVEFGRLVELSHRGEVDTLVCRRFALGASDMMASESRFQKADDSTTG